MRKLVYEIKDLKGFVLGVGYLKEKIMKEIDKNDLIEVDLLTNDDIVVSSKKTIKSDSNDKKKKGKSVSIKKLKKVFKKRRPDYIICNIDDVKAYLKYFIKDSMYITNQAIYVYSDSKDTDLNDILKRYRRYIDTVEYDNEYILINTTNYHSNMFKNIYYFIIDSFINLYEYIGSFLAG